MARAESKEIMGYLPFERRHYEALFSLVAPATPATRMLDPFSGKGELLEAAAKAWNVTPYANELDGDRAQQCITRFGPTQAVRCDVERLVASNEAFGILWANPPYDYDKTAKVSKRVEFAYLRHAWKWAADGALVFWVVYDSHLSEEAATFLAKNSRSVDVWVLPGKHLGEYSQIVVVALKGTQPEPGALYQHVVAAKAAPRPLEVQVEPIYRVPQPPDPNRKFVFAPDVIDETQGLLLIKASGAWKSQGFQSLLEIPAPPTEIEPVVAPRPGHLALALAAGVADGAVIETTDYGRVAVRGKTEAVEQIARVEVEAAPGDPDRQVKKTTIRLKPTTILTLLGADGTTVEMDGDEALLSFITANKTALAQYLNHKFAPIYQFDFAGAGRWLDRIKLKGKYPLYTAQKHVIGAVVKGFQVRDSILLVGQMGTGKTAMGGTTAIALAAQVVGAMQTQFRSNQVVLIVAPPHLVEKWKRELHSIHPNIVVERLDRHEDVKAFMDRAAKLGPGIAKIGLIKRDLTKLGCGWETAVVWRDRYRALWHHHAAVPEGYEPHQRLIKEVIPLCPHCGITVTQEKKGVSGPASKSWLEQGKRTCASCCQPLWREGRDKTSQPKVGEKYPSKNPRYRLDVYLKRHYPDRVALLIWDECHEAQHGDTGNGNAFGRMAGTAQKVLAMTGTPFNGRASSLFNLEYHLNPRVRQRYNWGGAPRLSRKARGNRDFPIIVRDDGNQRGRAESRWVADMGVREMVLEERPSYDSETGAFTGTSTYERPYEEAPGISPLLVAEVLDHAIFFSLGDLGKALPQFEEIALPVEMDPDTYEQYDRTRQQLKDYLIQRRWEGDTSFRGAYLQWAMGWANASFRPYEVIHNLKHPLTGEKQPYTVARLSSFGEERIFAKEQALLDLLTAELGANRPCVVYLRQTATRDIQPRLEALIRQHVPNAKPYILKNTVAAERREAVIEAEIGKGTNVLLCNPELVKTGLDLIHFPTLIFHEIVFNLGTMMQAAARSYRLNQTHTHCKVYYLFYEGTMEQTAVQLMSRKQRAAKLLTGDIGLTGLDALTEGEGSFEEALMDAIGRDDSLLDPAQLFKVDAGTSEIGAEDAAYWQREAAVNEPLENQSVYVTDPLLEMAQTLGAVVSAASPRTAQPVAAHQTNLSLLPATTTQQYLKAVVLITDAKRWKPLKTELLALLETNPNVQMVAAWLKNHQVVFPGCEDEVAGKLLTLNQLEPPSTPVLQLVDKPVKGEKAVTIPKPTREPIPFPTVSTLGAIDAPAQQLALF